MQPLATHELERARITLALIWTCAPKEDSSAVENGAIGCACWGCMLVRRVWQGARARWGGGGGTRLVFAR